MAERAVDGTLAQPGAAAGGAPALVAAKVVAEAAMLLRAVSPLVPLDPAIARTYQHVLARVAQAARRGDLPVVLTLEPDSAPECAAAHIHLSSLGRAWPLADRLLAEIFGPGAGWGGPERLPNHELERRWLLDIWGGRNDGVARDLLDRTCLARPLDGLAARPEDLYAFTHVVLYATDMGRRPLGITRSPGAIAADADLALAAAIDADNLDLAAEVLWAWPMIGLRWTPTATIGFGLLARAQDAHGFVPGPGYRAADAPADGAQEHVLRTSYHATLVTGILCAAALLTGRLPPREVPPTGRAGASTDAVLELLPRRSPEPAWRTAVSGLDAGARGSLGPFAMTVLLRRAHAARDVALLQSALALAVALNLDDTAIVPQAVALLRRTTILGRSLEAALGTADAADAGED